MRPNELHPTTYRPAPTARGLLVAYALVALVPVALWLVAHPLVTAAAAGLTLAAGALWAARPDHPKASTRRVCVPGTEVCVEA